MQLRSSPDTRSLLASEPHALSAHSSVPIAVPREVMQPPLSLNPHTDGGPRRSPWSGELSIIY